MIKQNQFSKFVIFLIMIANIEFFSIPGSYKLFNVVCTYHNKILVCVLSLILFCVECRTIIKFKKWQQKVMGIFILLICVVSFYSLVKYPDQNWFYLFRKYYYYLGLLFLFPMMVFIEKEGNMWWFLKLIAKIGLIYSSYVILVKIVYSVSGIILIDTDMQGILVRNGIRMANSATFVSVSSIISLATFIKIDRKKHKKVSNLFLFSFIVGTISIFYVAQTRMSELALVAGSIIIILSFISMRKKLAVFFSVIVLIGEIYRYLNDFFGSFYAAENFSSTRVRLAGYEYFLSHFFDGGIIGMGLIGSPTYYSILFGPYNKYHLSDLGYFGYFGVFGILGVAFIVYLFSAMFFNGRKSLTKKQYRLFPEINGYLVFILITGISLMFTDPQRCLYLPFFLLMYRFIELEAQGLTNANDYFKSAYSNASMID